jgi:hypothetical protein
LASWPNAGATEMRMSATGRNMETRGNRRRFTAWSFDGEAGFSLLIP